MPLLNNSKKKSKPEIQVLLFKTSWSGMSHLFEQRVVKVLSQLDRTNILKIIDIEVNSELAGRFGIYEVPSLLFISGDLVLSSLERTMGENEISHYLTVMDEQIKQLQKQDILTEE